MSDSFLLVSLQEDQAKKLAQVLSNDTSRKILDYLSSHKETTETELSKALAVPLSTVHYNLRHLVASRLVESDEYHYSEKGKEVSHYRLANKFVVIAPQDTSSLREKLMKLLPAALTIGAAASLLHYFLRPQTATPLYEQSFKAVAAPMAAAQDTALATSLPSSSPTLLSTIPASLWFLLGAVAALLAYMTWKWILGLKNRLCRKLR